MRASYRIYFRDRSGAILGRDDFDAEDDATAMMIAATLCDACSDICEAFELWQSSRRVDTSLSKRPDGSALAKDAQQIVLDREESLRDSRWTIAKSTRLLKQTDRMTAELRKQP